MVNIKQATFLVVDDSSAMRRIVVEMLRQMGAIYVDYASSGEEALQKIEASSVTIIISDWNMAPIDGPELLRAVKNIQKPRLNRFIFMTSETSYGHRATAKIEGADDFISKPFTALNLKQKVDKVLSFC